MANEAVLIFETGPPIPMTVANAVGYEKGAVGKLVDPITFSGITAVADRSEMIAGITASEKIASDGKTKLGVYREGIFKLTLSGVCVAGDALGTSVEDNKVNRVNPALSGARVLGIALEAGTNGETILVELRPNAIVADN